jgi:hypothetical protein
LELRHGQLKLFLICFYFTAISMEEERQRTAFMQGPDAYGREMTIAFTSHCLSTREFTSNSNAFAGNSDFR